METPTRRPVMLYDYVVALGFLLAVFLAAGAYQKVHHLEDLVAPGGIPPGSMADPNTELAAAAFGRYAQEIPPEPWVIDKGREQGYAKEIAVVVNGEKTKAVDVGPDKLWVIVQEPNGTLWRYPTTWQQWASVEIGDTWNCCAQNYYAIWGTRGHQ